MFPRLGESQDILPCSAVGACQNILSCPPVLQVPLEQEAECVFVEVEIATALALERAPNVSIFALLKIRGALTKTLQKQCLHLFARRTATRPPGAERVCCWESLQHEAPAKCERRPT